jgi:16S rRNA U1498 N3-methylase RsmE
VPIKASSWVCLRVFPSSHSNPVFVLVDGKPIRASKKSAEWCLAAVEQCRRQKFPRIREAERPAAQAAFDHARREYERLAKECAAD